MTALCVRALTFCGTHAFLAAHCAAPSLEPAGSGSQPQPICSGDDPPADTFRPGDELAQLLAHIRAERTSAVVYTVGPNDHGPPAGLGILEVTGPAAQSRRHRGLLPSADRRTTESGSPPLLRALAGPVRLRLMSIVASHQGAEACVRELNDAFGLSMLACRPSTRASGES